MNFNDGLTSVITSQGDPMRDKLAAVSFSGEILPDNIITNAFNTGWMAKRLVKAPATDALRNWRLWQGTASQVKPLENTEMRLGLKGKLLEAFILARALGGAAIFIGTGETDLSVPLNPDRLAKGGLKYLTVLPRTSVLTGELETDVTSPHFGRPSYYEMAHNNESSLAKIHPSRMVVLEGEAHLDRWAAVGPSRGWGQSIIQASYSALKNSASADDNVAGLIFEANINVISIPKLMEKLEDPRYEARLKSRLSLAAAQKGNHGDLLVDADETFARSSGNFANLDNIMERFAVLVGATQGIPASKFLGQMPKGIGSSANGELTNYYDDIKTIQTLSLQPAMSILDECIIRSALGSRPDDISYLWSPLAQPTSVEIAETGEKLSATLRNMAESGVYERAELREAFTNQFVNLDILPSLGDATLTCDKDLDDDFNLDVDNDGNDYGIGGNNTKADV